MYHPDPDDLERIEVHPVAVTDVLTAWTDTEGNSFGKLLDEAPEVRRPALWQWLRGRIGGAALLADTGIVLPELPIHSHEPSAALGARYTLLTAAVFALVTGSTPVWETVSGTLENAGKSEHSAAAASGSGGAE